MDKHVVWHGRGIGPPARRLTIGDVIVLDLEVTYMSVMWETVSKPSINKKQLDGLV